MQQKTYPEETNTAPDLFRPPSKATASTLSKVVPDPMAETTTGSTAGESKQSSAGAAPDVVLRLINLNKSEDNPTMSNVVKTATYTWYSFIPLFLFFQFRRPANIYFLTICVLQVGTNFLPLSPPLAPLSELSSQCCCCGIFHFFGPFLLCLFTPPSFMILTSFFSFPLSLSSLSLTLSLTLLHSLSLFLPSSFKSNKTTRCFQCGVLLKMYQPWHFH